MFKNLRTGTKLFVLCGVFIISIGLTVCNLVAEKQIAIDFARKELVGTRYLAAVRAIYAALTDPASDTPSEQPKMSRDDLLKTLATAEAGSAAMLKTAELEKALAATLGELWSNKAEGTSRDAIVLDALAKARSLASRIGDDSNLTLDPDLDTFYVQDIVVVKLPTLLSQLSEVQTLLQEAAAEPSAVHNIRILILDGFLQSTADGIETNLAAAYRGNTDGKLKPAVQANIAEMISDASSYLSRVKEIMAAGEVKTADTASFERAATSAMRSAIDAWTVTQAELDRLLRQRIDGLLDKLWRSLMVISIVGCLSILIAFMTHQHIVRPLARLENMARTVRETKNYNLRADISSRDEIGRLAAAFNDMLAELAEARKREVADHARTAAMQSELARATRLTTMGEMAASIAHEINQPLGAIVAQGNAGLRWLKRQIPDLHEVEQTLKHIVSDGYRASQVISGIRTMFKKDGQSKTRLDINDLIREVLALVDREVENQRVFVRTDLIEELPQVLVDRVQMQQVILNLIMNAFDAMESLNDRARVLQLKSEKHEPSGVLVTVEDSGTGIEKENMDRIFESFFTTKSRGMGMGLAICRSIVEGHGGRLTASRGYPHGTVFQVVLPIYAPVADRTRSAAAAV